MYVYLLMFMLNVDVDICILLLLTYCNDVFVHSGFFHILTTLT